MISKFVLLLTTLFLGVGMSTTSTTSTESVFIQAVDNLENISVDNYDDSYLGTIFYKPIDESKIQYVNDLNLRSAETDEVEEVDVYGKFLGA